MGETSICVPLTYLCFSSQFSRSARSSGAPSSSDPPGEEAAERFEDAWRAAMGFDFAGGFLLGSAPGDATAGERAMVLVFKF